MKLKKQLPFSTNPVTVLEHIQDTLLDIQQLQQNGGDSEHAFNLFIDVEVLETVHKALWNQWVAIADEVDAS